ncbi:signal peptidase I [Candidatus Uhrbacteria bacterium CG10_big_fil_rev_8_21_14_0_10_48_11]|uniref:Signal peptidase I n=1 Tax=Candidatus Uhrbacteria bacterium CG10_big_fil_rev_8_21_14_0_10_48_11 TaxID=1975037 RepID=A0A2M8LF50_9BACT|nr:MAG: signal peptidase I [Candidatus Uhrbacteria bacterium CG10_big_fil_rev_8_21_14_0_10_48_11]
MQDSNGNRPTTKVFRELGEFVVELLKVVLISLAIILPVRYYVVQPFYVKGASMEPTFDDNQYLLIDELSYRFAQPERGDIIVFRYPRDPSQFFIKRVIGLPGEKVTIENGHLTITPKSGAPFALVEPFLPVGVTTMGEFNVEVPDGHYFVMGDNRSASLDSRVFGPVASRYIVGRVWVRAWPFNDIRVFPYNLLNSQGSAS